MRVINRYITALLAGGAIIGLSACGGSTSAVTEPSTAAPRSTAPITAVQPRATSSAAPSTTAAATTEAAPRTTSTELARADRPYGVLPQSKTAQGYYVLGQPDAPVVLTYYSDFL